MEGWMKNVRRVEPYVPGEQPKGENIIKLNTNENPYPPAPGVERAIKALTAHSFRLYPDPSSERLINELADFYQVKKNQVFAGVGSDDVLAAAFMTFFNSHKPVLFPDITYSFYEVWAGLFSIPFETPALDESFRIKKEDYYRENGGIVIANPNAPTSICEDLDFIEDILVHNPDSVVIVDEAYIDFGGMSALSLIKKYDNLLVVQTFSKSRSMAGMRIGYGIGSEKLIKALNNVKYSYNSYTLNQASLVLGTEALKDREYFENNLEKIIKVRENTEKRLKKLGFSFPKSKANFIFASHETVPARELFEMLRGQGIYVRYFDKPRINNYLRITVGTEEQMDILIAGLEEYITSRK